jgi:hypothetical protein
MFCHGFCVAAVCSLGYCEMQYLYAGVDEIPSLFCCWLVLIAGLLHDYLLATGSSGCCMMFVCC